MDVGDGEVAPTLSDSETESEEQHPVDGMDDKAVAEALRASGQAYADAMQQQQPPDADPNHEVDNEAEAKAKEALQVEQELHIGTQASARGDAGSSRRIGTRSPRKGSTQPEPGAASG